MPCWLVVPAVAGYVNNVYTLYSRSMLWDRQPLMLEADLPESQN